MRVIDKSSCPLPKMSVRLFEPLDSRRYSAPRLIQHHVVLGHWSEIFYNLMRNLPKNAHFFIRDAIERFQNHVADFRQQLIDQTATLIGKPHVVFAPIFWIAPSLKQATLFHAV